MLTLFTSPKPFTGPISQIQKNAIGSWLDLHPAVEILLIGNEQGMAEAAEEFGVMHIPEIDRNDQGTPLISSVFEKARAHAKYPILCFANADMLFFDDFIPAVSLASDQLEKYLILGQRWDLEVQRRLSFENGWQQKMRSEIEQVGALHPPAGSDYFVFPKTQFNAIPAFALGRAGWDNWMIYAARSANIPVLDATMAITAVHQNHDYAHLPGGKPHYNLPESNQNVFLAGGQKTIFTLNDADWRLTKKGIQRRSLIERGLVRTIEAEVISRYGPGKIAWATHFLLHPIEVIRYYASGIGGRLSGNMDTRMQQDEDQR